MHIPKDGQLPGLGSTHSYHEHTRFLVELETGQRHLEKQVAEVLTGMQRLETAREQRLQWHEPLVLLGIVWMVLSTLIPLLPWFKPGGQAMNPEVQFAREINVTFKEQWGALPPETKARVAAIYGKFGLAVPEEPRGPRPK